MRGLRFDPPSAFGPAPLAVANRGGSQVGDAESGQIVFAGDDTPHAREPGD